jgi:drug/metabolite transporter (DMT)-like permease
MGPAEQTTASPDEIGNTDEDRAPAPLQILPYVWMLAGAFSFALMAVCAHGLKERCDWQVIALARSLIPLGLAAGMSWMAGVRLVFFGSRSLWLRSICGSTSLVSTFFALTRMPVSDVLTLTNLFPIWVAILSWPLLGMLPGLDTWGAAIAGIAGIWLIQQPHMANGNLASFAALGASFFSGLAMIGLHRLHRLDPRAIVVHFSLVSLLFTVTAFLLFERHHSLEALSEPGILVRLAGVGVFATIGQFFLTKAFISGQPAKVSVVGLTQVGFGAIFDALLWNRQFPSTTILGMLLVIAPTGWLMWRQARSIQPEEIP